MSAADPVALSSEGQSAHFRHIDWDIMRRLETMPTFLGVEIAVLGLSVFTFVHALSQPGPAQSSSSASQSHVKLSPRALHVLLWLAAVLGGVSNDVFFMALPVVDNFWHAQATLMITPRLPLYIVALYNVFLYIPTAFLWWVRVPARALSPLVGLLTTAFYAPVDVVGARFLWWTWHDTDNTIVDRLVGVPVASSCWVCVYSCCFTWLFARLSPSTQATGCFAAGRTFFRPLLLLCLSSVPLMMLHMMVLQMLFGGSFYGGSWLYVPGLPPSLPPVGRAMFFSVLALYAVLAAQFAAVAREDKVVGSGGGDDDGDDGDAVGGGGGGEEGGSRYEPVPARSFQMALVWFVVLAAHFVLYLVVSQWCDPSAVRSFGVHQSVGPCELEATDYTGQARFVHVCPGKLNHTDYFTFADDDHGSITAAAAASSSSGDALEWYEICGTEATKVWRLAAATECLVGLFLYLGFWYWRVQQLFAADTSSSSSRSRARGSSSGRQHTKKRQ